MCHASDRDANGRPRQTPALELTRMYFLPFNLGRNASKSLKRGACFGILEKADVRPVFLSFIGKMLSRQNISVFRRFDLTHLRHLVALHLILEGGRPGASSSLGRY
jgi:hypothetical protein